MTADRDTTRIVRSWLRANEHESADRVLQTVLARLDTTPQRRPMRLPRRNTDMNIYARLAIGAAAALAVVFLGLRLLPASGPGPGGQSPVPSRTVAPTVVPSTPPMPPDGTALEPGTYVVRSYTETPFEVTVPAGWTVTFGMIHKGDFYNTRTAVLLRPWIVTHVYGDSCHWRGTLHAVGPTKAELVVALSTQTGRDATGPKDVVLGGLPATKFLLSVPGTFDASACDDEYLRPWPDTGGNEASGPPMFTGSITQVYIVETGGKATAIQAASYEGSSAADIAELQKVLDSIVFVP